MSMSFQVNVDKYQIVFWVESVHFYCSFGYIFSLCHQVQLNLTCFDPRKIWQWSMVYPPPTVNTCYPLVQNIKTCLSHGNLQNESKIKTMFIHFWLSNTPGNVSDTGGIRFSHMSNKLISYPSDTLISLLISSCQFIGAEWNVHG